MDGDTMNNPNMKDSRVCLSYTSTKAKLLKKSFKGSKEFPSPLPESPQPRWPPAG